MELMAYEPTFEERRRDRAARRSERRARESAAEARVFGAILAAEVILAAIVCHAYSAAWAAGLLG